MNVFKPKKADLRGRSQERMEYLSNQNNGIINSQRNNSNYLKNKNMGNNLPNRYAYTKKIILLMKEIILCKIIIVSANIK